MEILNENKLITATYDFSQDGGAVGNISLGVTLLQFAVVKNFFVRTITAPTSAGAATISFGIVGAIDFFMVAQPFTNFNTTNKVVAGKSFSVAPVETGINDDLIITIGTANLTAGRLIIYLDVAIIPQ